MKKTKLLILLTIALVFSSFSSFSQDVNLGGGLVIGTDRPTFGIQIKGTYGLDMMLENLSTSVGVTVFFPKSVGTTDYWRLAIDIDGNYTFYSLENFDFFAIAGLNITYYKRESSPTLLSDASGTMVGLNVGAGVKYKINQKLTAYSQFKYIATVTPYAQGVFTVGVLVGL